MVHRLDPAQVHANAVFLLDLVSGGTATRFFEHGLDEIQAAASLRSIDPDIRRAVCDALLAYNTKLGAGQETLDNLAQLGDASTLCVLGGQQAGFLGGPQFVAYKIASIIRLARRCARLLDRPVVPIFWLATEDHDFQEINRVRILDAGTALRTASFDWEGEGQPIERLPVTPSIQAAQKKALQWMEPLPSDVRALFAPEAGDDYGLWHARIWSRAFSSSGLILVEPRVLRSLAGPFFAAVQARYTGIQEDMGTRAATLEAAGYPVPLDPESAGRLFTLDPAGRRIRSSPMPAQAPASTLDPVKYSPDAALRPLLSDTLLPTLAHVVGPSELAYHAMLQPIYQRLGIQQPIVAPRFSATLLQKTDLDLLEAFDLHLEDLIHPRQRIQDAVAAKVSPELRTAFAKVQAELATAMRPLAAPLEALEPGLVTRWRQTCDQVQHQLERLEARVLRVELGHRGLSVRMLQRIAELVFPGQQLQERGLSFFHFAGSYGIQWIDDLLTLKTDDRFGHYVISL